MHQGELLHYGWGFSISVITCYIQSDSIKLLEVPGIEPGAFRMRSEHSTTELHPHCYDLRLMNLYFVSLLVPMFRL